MKYYLVRQPSDPQIIGLKDGGSQAEINRGGFKNKSNYDNFMLKFFDNTEQKYWEVLEQGLPNLNINLECVKLRNGAKVTDFLSYYPNLYFGGKFLLSKKAVNIISQFNLPQFKLYPAQLIANQNTYEYKLLYTPVIKNNINFQKTIFYTGNKLTGKRRFKLNSTEEFKKKKDSDIFRTEKVVFDYSFDENLDYFIPLVTIPHIFISERLKLAIEENNLTGISILDANDPAIEVDQNTN